MQVIANALAPSDGLSSCLTILDVSGNSTLFCDADPSQAGRFGAAMASCSALIALYLAATGIGTMAARSREAFLTALGSTSSVTSLDVGHNELGITGGKDLAAALRSSLGAQLVCLELCGNALCAPAGTPVFLSTASR